jgi:predicted metal-dependent enzyme (double-stranded beta helix superfamily)
LQEGDMKESNSIRRFVADLRDAQLACTHEAALLARVRDLVADLAAQRDGWLTGPMCRPDPDQGFGMHVLHEEADHTLAVFVVSWVPGGGAPPHDHGTWAVIAGLDGLERNAVWRRVDDCTRPGYADLAPLRDQAVGAGDVIVLPTGAIHSVHNDSTQVTVSLHVYGRHVNYTERSQFDPAARTQTPYTVRVSS